PHTPRPWPGRSLYAPPEPEESNAPEVPSRRRLRAADMMAPAFVPMTITQGALARDLPETALHVTSRRLTTRPSTLPSPARLCGHVGPARGREPPAHQWHARGQGFKSPQLHQAQRIGRTPAQGCLSADCQQITSCGHQNILSSDWFGGF